jgi:DNA-binding response OmpR family regulator
MAEKGKILVAEDEEMIRKIVEEVLGSHYNLSFAENGYDAIEKARSFNPELILLDIMMPKYNGFEVCEELREDSAFKKTIIIMVTALADKDSYKQAIKAGADDFITKPFNPVDLRTKVQLMFRLRNRLICE